MAKRETLYGGQAVIEGVMMRGADHFAVACRRTSGDIALTVEPVPKALRPHWQKLPLLRGAFSLVDAMTLGTKAMFWAAKVAEQDIIRDAMVGAAQAEAEARDIRLTEEIAGPALGTAVAAPDPLPIGGLEPGPRVTDVAIGSAMVTGLLLALIMIYFLPNLAIGAVKRTGIHAIWQLGMIDGVLRFGIFFGYIGLISQMAHVRRVFQYHGAEHKAINALEAGGAEGLTVDAARAASRLHPRCGTSFLVIVLLLSTVAISPFYFLPTYERVPIHLLLSLPIAGVSFELLRLAGKYRSHPVAAALSRPGMWTQLLTTREPDDSQLEVALESLKAVMAAGSAATDAASETATTAAAAAAAAASADETDEAAEVA